jgi:hypothetical protein
MKKVNDWLDKIAVKITSAVGSMWCAILFTILALTSLPSIISQSIQTSSIAPLIQWIAQTFLQLVLLSIILKGQNIGSAQLEKVIDRINDNTAKTEAAAERIEHIVQMIEMKEERELDDIEKTK